MNFLNKSLAAFLMLFVCLFAVPRQQFYDLGDFRLESGKVLEECRIGYRTCGKLNENKDNIILFPTWFGGTSEHIWSLVDTYGFIDTSDYYIVITDALANGISTSPSNSRRQGGKVFPQVEISDMARVAYSVVKDHLGFDRIHAIVGGSMGSMQGFELISLYPDFADKAVLYVSSPRETAYDIMLQEVFLDIIELGRKYNIPEAEFMKTVNLLNYVNARTPKYYSEEVTCCSGRTQIEQYEKYSPGLFTADNFYVQKKAIQNHDISRNDNNNLSLTALRIKSNVLIIVNEHDHMVSPYPALVFAKMIKARTLVLDNKYGHLGVIPEIDRVKRVVHNFLR